MSRPSRPKHLVFYVTVIGIVLILFQVVTAYGEGNLKAPPNLNGRYLSTSAPPGCPQDARLMLTLQQSGIYVNGFLTLESANLTQSAQSTDATSEEKSSLTGLWKPEQLSLSGETDALATCAGGSSGKVGTAIALQGQVASTGFTGQLAYSTSQASQASQASQPWQFTAQRQALVKAKTGH